MPNATPTPAEIAEPYVQGFADARHSGTRWGPVHLFDSEQETVDRNGFCTVPLCGRRVKRWNFEGETETDFCPKCLRIARENQQPQPRELLYCFDLRNLNVLVPKKRGEGFLAVPYGHHYDAKLDAIATKAGCDVTGLDGHLAFDCGASVAVNTAAAHTYAAKIMPLLAAHYACSFRAVSPGEFHRLHPVAVRRVRNQP